MRVLFFVLCPFLNLRMFVEFARGCVELCKLVYMAVFRFCAGLGRADSGSRVESRVLRKTVEHS